MWFDFERSPARPSLVLGIIAKTASPRENKPRQAQICVVSRDLATCSRPCGLGRLAGMAFFPLLLNCLFKR